MKKVYCKGCEFYNHPNVDGYSIYSYCKAYRTRIDTPNLFYYNNPETKEVNADNDCAIYEPGWCKRLGKVLQRGKE